jgi:hypothetical protein
MHEVTQGRKLQLLEAKNRLRQELELIEKQKELQIIEIQKQKLKAEEAQQKRMNFRKDYSEVLTQQIRDVEFKRGEEKRVSEQEAAKEKVF